MPHQHLTPDLLGRCDGCFELLTAARCTTCERIEASPDALVSGTRLAAGRFVLGKPLGRPGGFGITYYGWDRSLERRVAIKEFFPRNSARRRESDQALEPVTTWAGEFRAQLTGFLEEAQRAARIEHENVVKILDFTEGFGTGYIIMPYYDGETLAAFRTRQPQKAVSWDVAVALMLPVLDALGAVHAAGMVHRDVKPANVYLARTGANGVRPVLLDFGAARRSSTSRRLTGILSEHYAPPEQYDLEGATQGPWTDVYAAAATLHELLSGCEPTPAPARQFGSALSDIRAVQPNVPAALLDALDAAMHLDYRERVRDATTFATKLRASGQTADDSKRRRARAPRVGAPRASVRAATAAAIFLSAGVATIWALPDSVFLGASPTGDSVSLPSSLQGERPDSLSGYPDARGTLPNASSRLDRPPRESGVAKTAPLGKSLTAADSVAHSALQTKRRARAEQLLGDGDYFGAMESARQAAYPALMDRVRAACTQDSLIAARRGAPVACPR